MGRFKIGEQVCNNCIHWRCSDRREFQGNPPREVYTCVNCADCGRTGRSQHARDSCPFFTHVGGVTVTFPSSTAAERPRATFRETSPGENYFNAVMGFIQGRRAINAASRLADQYFQEEEARLSRNRDDEKRILLIRHGMSRSASSSDRRAFEVLYENAVADDPEAQLYLAHCFQHGEYGAERNPALAAKWCLKAACHENADAQNLLGTFYLDGFGVERDTRKAGALFRSAAKLGSREAARNYKVLTGTI